jgi:hypothetical protein
MCPCMRFWEATSGHAESRYPAGLAGCDEAAQLSCAQSSLLLHIAAGALHVIAIVNYIHYVGTWPFATI